VEVLEKTLVEMTESKDMEIKQLMVDITTIERTVKEQQEASHALSIVLTATQEENKVQQQAHVEVLTQLKQKQDESATLVEEKNMYEKKCVEMSAAMKKGENNDEITYLKQKLQKQELLHQSRRLELSTALKKVQNTKHNQRYDQRSDENHRDQKQHEAEEEAQDHNENRDPLHIELKRARHLLEDQQKHAKKERTRYQDIILALNTELQQQQHHQQQQHSPQENEEEDHHYQQQFSHNQAAAQAHFAALRLELEAERYVLK
jgi:hypothetical protein